MPLEDALLTRTALFIRPHAGPKTLATDFVPFRAKFSFRDKEIPRATLCSNPEYNGQDAAKKVCSKIAGAGGPWGAAINSGRFPPPRSAAGARSVTTPVAPRLVRRLRGSFYPLLSGDEPRLCYQVREHPPPCLLPDSKRL